MWAAATVGDHSEGNAGYCGDLSSVWLVICYLKMAGATKLEVVFSVHMTGPLWTTEDHWGGKKPDKLSVMRRESGETADPRAQLVITATASTSREIMTEHNTNKTQLNKNLINLKTSVRVSGPASTETMGWKTARLRSICWGPAW